jgi:hypothetical protein
MSRRAMNVEISVLVICPSAVLIVETRFAEMLSTFATTVQELEWSGRTVPFFATVVSFGQPGTGVPEGIHAIMSRALRRREE